MGPDLIPRTLRRILYSIQLVGANAEYAPTSLATSPLFNLPPCLQTGRPVRSDDPSAGTKNIMISAPETPGWVYHIGCRRWGLHYEAGRLLEVIKKLAGWLSQHETW